MDIVVFLAVLIAAAAHAGWNALIKGTGDPLVTTVQMSTAAMLVGIVLLALAGLPNNEAWPWVIASSIIHIVYFASLVEAYGHGDLSQVYPIARGSAPLLTGLLGAVFLGENLTTFGWAGMFLLVGGVLLLSFGSGRALRIAPRGLAFALLTALTISAYTMTDGIGARASGNPMAYTASLFIGCGLGMLAYILWRRGWAALAGMAQNWRNGALGGTMQLVSYGIAIWAMTLAPIAVVGALRETSVVFGTLIAIVVLKEPLNLVRIAAVVIVACGLLLLRLA
ncbi:MAG TPA: EamA family transporter [Xanthobacteraceae bacterium]|jgi:drug/metabolite transporter (DMT)-like permease|nr:EamA family transporter [Xanthobacteraceae bacterium]